MLSYLHVKNIALIDEVELKLGHHLNIFTGETGAGKSMLIDSIQFAIGNRTSKNIIRKDQNYAYVKMAFIDTKGLGMEYIKRNGFPYEKEGEIDIERTLYLSGRTVYKINGITAARQAIKELAALLIDVHGQHEPQSLLDVSRHTDMLDSFGDEAFMNLKEAYRSCYEKWIKIKEKMKSIGNNERKRLQMKDMLLFQLEEINRAKLKPGEEEVLKEQYDILSHAEKIIVHCQNAYEFLEEGGSEGLGAGTLIGKTIKSLQEIHTISPQLKSLYDQMLSIEAQLQDVSYEIRKYTDTIEYSPEILLEVQNRLDTIYKLKQKYGNSISDILYYKEKCEKELQEIENAAEDQVHLQKEKEHIEKVLFEKATLLSEARVNLATQIQGKIDHHLHDLQMPYAKFEVALNKTNTFSVTGQEEVEFMIRTNLGEDIHPLSKIASGGEISRVMLAIKAVLVLGDVIETVIFDEIDTGISGVAAQKVAEKLAYISSVRQVICITHLPQIAAMGENHYLIEKITHDNRTTTQLKKLELEKIYEELSRLMGGLITENTLESAKELKDLAIAYKKFLF
jgi:DNA repair protein RecN (Recombination protein N)